MRYRMSIMALCATVLALSAGAGAQTPGGRPPSPGAQAECPVAAAADAALQRQIDLLDQLKVDPAQFFQGENSCIDPSLLQSFDISSMIPDPIGLLQRIAQNLGPNLLDAARRKVCGVLNNQLGRAVGGMRSVMNQGYGTDRDIQEALDRVTNRAGLDRIRLDGLGQYGSGGGWPSSGGRPSSGGSLPELDLPPPPVLPRIQAPAPAPAVSQPSPGGRPPAASDDAYRRRLRCSFLGDC